MKTENPLAGSKESVSMIRDTLYPRIQKDADLHWWIPFFMGPAADLESLEFIEVAAQVDYSLNLRSLRSMLRHQCCPRYIHNFFEG
jgi:hypothetical protein